MIVALALACTDPPNKDEGGADTADTAASVETGDTAPTVDSADTGNSGDTGAPRPPTPVTVTVDASLVGATFVVTRLHPVDFSGATFGDPLLATAVPSASFALELPAPDPAETTLEDSPRGDVLAARYFASVHDDTNGDGVVNADEVVLAIGTGELVYAEAESVPMQPGWNFFAFGSGGFAYSAGLSKIDTLAFTPDLPLTLSGSATVAGATPRVAAASAGETFADEPFTTTFALTLDRRGLVLDAGSSPRGARVGVLAYDDLDGSSSYTSGDTRLGGACSRLGFPAAAWFTDLPRGLDEAFPLYPWAGGLGYSYLPGWTVFEAREGDWAGEIWDADADTLSLDAACEPSWLP